MLDKRNAAIATIDFLPVNFLESRPKQALQQFQKVTSEFSLIFFSKESKIVFQKLINPFLYFLKIFISFVSQIMNVKFQKITQADKEDIEPKALCKHH